jgi:tetratricopeptide (TPR) repeat protein
LTASPRKPCLLLAGAAVLPYLNALRSAFQFDDYNVIVDNPAVHSWTAFMADAGQGIRPVLKLSYTLNWLADPGPAGFHLVNVAVHAANTLLVYFLSLRLGKPTEAGLPSRPAGAVSLLAALLFAVHPVQTEGVTYVCGRSVSLMGFFYLASLLAYDRGARGGDRLLLWLVSPAFFLLAVLTRETALTLPAALALWEAPHWILLGLLLFWLAARPAAADLYLYGLTKRSVADNALSQVNGVTYLLSRLLFAHRLNIDPDLPVLTGWSLALAAQAVFLASLLALGTIALRRRPRLGFGLLWFFLQLLPTNSLIPRLDIANERHLYLAAWGLFLPLGEVMGTAWREEAGSARGRKVAVAAALAAAALLTVVRNHDYRSEVALWERTALLSPGKPRVHNNLGYAYQLAGEPEKAARSYEEALRLDPKFRKARANLKELASEKRPDP